MDRQSERVNGRPVIAVTGPDTRYPIAWWATRLAVFLAGGTAVRLTPLTYRQHRKERFQGVIIGGGSDIDPKLYGGDDTGASRKDPERDAFEIEMIEYALARKLPVLGICRGAQLINVVLGGTLYNDIRGLRRRTSNRRTPLPRKTALIKAGTQLSQILGAEKCRINSLHHQAIHTLGRDLAASAHDLDSFIQAIESTRDSYIMGVQWHPEYLSYLSKQRHLLNSFIQAAARNSPRKLND
ncbi:peptidase C26 [Methylomonas methanica MC09]|uniref:Peptidase C26 n=1 Tax=Methylomonas methanica (strain DSM 25384 / MC09) TaxID=857087 RepID=G0A6P5_METMM|nr:peptidase C26 [Methylomonas methanica MC09]